MPPTNDGDTTNRDEMNGGLDSPFNEPIQYVNDSPTSLPDQRSNTNPIPFTTGVYSQEPITYKHPYILLVPSITPTYTSSRYTNRKYCLFYLNLTFASNDYAWNSDEFYNMSIN